MTKDEKYELIELSDLNREDNVRYISSEAQGIAITLDSDRYAPTFCKLERAYICGRRKSEKRIEELEETIANLKEQVQSQVVVTIELDKENAELKEQNKWLEGCKSELGEHLGKANDKIADLEKENAELNEYKNGNFVQTVNQIIEGKDKQLTKAKEIIKKYMLYCKGELTHYKDIEEQAEQFIKEIE